MARCHPSPFTHPPTIRPAHTHRTTNPFTLPRSCGETSSLMMEQLPGPCDTSGNLCPQPIAFCPTLLRSHDPRSPPSPSLPWPTRTGVHPRIGCSHADRLITYPHVRFLSGCELVPGPGNPPKTPNLSQSSSSDTTRVGFLFRVWARSPTRRIAGLRADEWAQVWNSGPACA